VKDVPEFLSHLRRDRRGLPWSRRFLVVSSMSVEQIQLAGRAVAVVTEPWLDQRCAEFALGVCPGLIRRRTAHGLALVAVTSKREVQLVVSNGWVDGHLEDESKQVMPAMWCKVALTGVRIEMRERAS
jgi:hypothetical protein